MGFFSDLRQELGVRKRPASESSQKDVDDIVTTPTNITSKLEKLERLSSQTNSHVPQVVRPDSLNPESHQSSHGATVTPNKGNINLILSCFISGLK